MNRISLPLMDTIDTSRDIVRRSSSAMRETQPRSADNSDSDSDTESSSLGDTFITRYLKCIRVKG